MPTSDVDGILGTAPELRISTFGSTGGNTAFAILGAKWAHRAHYRQSQWALAPHVAPKHDDVQEVWEYYIEFTLRRAFLANAQESRHAQKQWHATLKQVMADRGDLGVEEMLASAAFDPGPAAAAAAAAPQSSAAFCARHPSLVEDVTLGPVDGGRSASGGFRRARNGDILFKITLLSNIKSMTHQSKAFAWDRKNNPFHEMWRWALNTELQREEPSLLGATDQRESEIRLLESKFWTLEELYTFQTTLNQLFFEVRNEYLGQRGEMGDAPALSTELEALLSLLS